MAKKIGEVFEQNGQVYIVVDREDPTGPHLKLEYSVKTPDGRTSAGVYLIPGRDDWDFLAKLEDFIKLYGGFTPKKSDILIPPDPDQILKITLPPRPR